MGQTQEKGELKEPPKKEIKSGVLKRGFKISNGRNGVIRIGPNNSSKNIEGSEFQDWELTITQCDRVQKKGGIHLSNNG